MIVFDGETDGLLREVSKIHCINALDRADGKRLRFNEGRYADGTKTKRDGSIADALELLKTTRPIAGQNIIKYDVPVFQKLYPDWAPTGPMFDTKVAASVIWTNLKDVDFALLRKGVLPEEFQKKGLIGSNSLEAWGYRLDPDGSKGFRKGDSGVVDNDWTLFTQQVDDYCAQDVEVANAFIDKVNSKNYSAECLSMEMRVAEIIARQERHGVRFDIEAAEKLYVELTKKKLELEDSLRDIFPPWEVETKRFIAKVNNKKYGLVKGQLAIRTKQVIFNPGSREHIADRFKTIYGWTPTEFTPKGKPKIDEEILSALPYPEAKPVSRYLDLGKVLGMLGDGKPSSTWLRAVDDDGRIRGTVHPNGAVTGRMTHNSPNLSQVPKVKVGPDGPLLGEEGGWGYECRGLFGPSAGKVQVGCDAEGLELRMLGHYMAPWDDGAFALAVVQGNKAEGTDNHSLTQKAAGLNSRDSAKTFIYALLYGAGNFKLGTIVYDDMTEKQQAAFNAKTGRRDRKFATLGKARRARLMEGLPALGRLTAAVKDKASKTQTLRGLDGRILHVRSDHAALNTLLQSGGAVVMKKALVLLDDAIHANPDLAGRVDFMLNVHDEFQMETDPEIAEHVGQLAADSIRLAGEFFNLACPLAGAYDIGNNWAETH